jgi:putative phage-type endonuclease
MTYTVEHYDNRQAWLEARQRGIGASDAAAVLGLSGYSSPYSVWYSKTSPIEDRGDEDELIYWGRRLEPIIADEFWKEAGDAFYSV